MTFYPLTFLRFLLALDLAGIVFGSGARMHGDLARRGRGGGQASMESRDMASGEHHENQVEQSSERKGPATIGDYRRNAAPPLYNTLVTQKWWGTPSYGYV